MKDKKFKAVAHYLRMIDAAMLMNDKDIAPYNPLYSVMDDKIGESWYSKDCSYCIADKEKKSVPCNLCELMPECLWEDDVDGLSVRCCGGLWWQMSSTYIDIEDWIYKATKVLWYIIENG